VGPPGVERGYNVAPGRPPRNGPEHLPWRLVPARHRGGHRRLHRLPEQARRRPIPPASRSTAEASPGAGWRSGPRPANPGSPPASPTPTWPTATRSCRYSTVLTSPPSKARRCRDRPSRQPGFYEGEPGRGYPRLVGRAAEDPVPAAVPQTIPATMKNCTGRPQPPSRRHPIRPAGIRSSRPRTAPSFYPASSTTSVLKHRVMFDWLDEVLGQH